MKSASFIFSILSSALCLVLGVWIFFLGLNNQVLQTELQKVQQDAQSQQQILQGKQQALQAQQEQINAGNTISQQVGPALLRDLGSLSVKNEKIKEFLTKHGYTVEQKPAEAAK